MEADRTFDRLERQARRIGCRIMTAAAFEAFEKRDRRHGELVDEITRLRAEVSGLHWKLKSRRGRMLSRWYRVRQRRVVGLVPRLVWRAVVLWGQPALMVHEYEQTLAMSTTEQWEFLEVRYLAHRREKSIARKAAA